MFLWKVSKDLSKKEALDLGKFAPTVEYSICWERFALDLDLVIKCGTELNITLFQLFINKVIIKFKFERLGVVWGSGDRASVMERENELVPLCSVSPQRPNSDLLGAGNKWGACNSVSCLLQPPWMHISSNERFRMRQGTLIWDVGVPS